MRMPQVKLSVNRTAQTLVDMLCENAQEYGVAVRETKSGATIIDAGIKARGGFLAGKIITEICLGGYGKAEISYKKFNDSQFPSITVYSDYPSISALGSQFAGWQIKVDKYSAMGSGPARALALKPKKLYEKIGYFDEADMAVLVLETSKEPPENVIEYISGQCKVSPDRLSLISVPTSSIAGTTQISGRIVETGIHKLTELGLDPKCILSGIGYAPIPPIHPNSVEAMGRSNDAILYAGITWYTVSLNSDEEIQELILKAPSLASKSYGRPFTDIFKEANYDFYKIDPDLFAPATLIINNLKTGKVFKAGKTNIEIYKRSIGLK